MLNLAVEEGAVVLLLNLRRAEAPYTGLVVVALGAVMVAPNMEMKAVHGEATLMAEEAPLVLLMLVRLRLAVLETQGLMAVATAVEAVVELSLVEQVEQVEMAVRPAVAVAEAVWVKVRPEQVVMEEMAQEAK